MEILHEFGIDWMLLAAQAINFLIILYVLKRFAYKPILTLLENLERTIQKGLEDAEEARIRLEKAAEKERELLKKAQTDAKKLLNDAKEQSAEMLRKSEEATKQQAEKILREAREQISFESKEAERRLSGHISELAMHFLQKSIEELFSENEQEVIMRSALKRMKTKKN